MNYQKHYDLLIEKAKIRLNVTGYKEKHHIRPKCIGGTNEKENLVILTAEEHYIAHLLLAKIYSHVPPLINAAAMMACRNNKNYGWVMRKYAKVASDRFKGVPKSIEQRKKQSEAKKKLLEFNGKQYLGYSDLTSHTGITYHLYNKYYLKGIDPLPFIGNNTYGMIDAVKKNPPRSSENKSWYNDGINEVYSKDQIEGWNKGRLMHTRDSKGRYSRNIK
jgi:hypothetical protein